MTGAAAPTPAPAPVFLVGASRSGTTLLRLMLNEHPDLKIPAESHFLGALLPRFGPTATLAGAQLDEAVTTVASFDQWRDDYAYTAAELRAAVGNGPLTMAELVDRIFRLEVGSAPARWGDKSPPYLRWVDLLLECFPAGQVIAIVRDPRDVYASLARLGWFGGTPWSIGRYLAECGEYVRRWRRELPDDRFRVVRYEDLVLDTERVLHEVCAFLGLPFVSEMHEFFAHAADNLPAREITGHHAKLRRAPSRDDVERWRSSHAYLRLAEIEALTATVMDEYGYARRVPDWACASLATEARLRSHLRAPRDVVERNVGQVVRRIRAARRR